MKEQIIATLSSRAQRGDLIQKEIASLDIHRGRNDRSLGLTIHRLPPTLRMEENIFMPEPGQAELPPNKDNVPKPPELPKPRIEIGSEIDHAQEAVKSISPERVAKVRELWEKYYLRGRDLTSLPHDERQSVEAAIELGLPPIAGGQNGEEEQGRMGVDEATRRLEAAARGLGLDPRLQPIRDRVLRLRLDDMANIEGNMQVLRGEMERIANIASESGIDPALVSQAATLEGFLRDEYTRLADLRSGQIEAINRERERYGVFRERRLEPQEKEDIKEAVLGLTEQEMRTIERVPDRPSPDLTEQQIQERREEIRRQRERLRNVDRIFNRMFENVDANPKLQFQEGFSAGQYEYLEFVQTINERLADVGDAPDAYQVRQQILRHLRGYVEERKLREAAHNANFVVVADAELDQLIGFVKGVQSEEVDLAFSKTGVSTVLHFYEQALLKVREENDGYIPTYAVVGEAKEGSRGRVDDLTRVYINEAIRIGILPDMQDWEIDRAISLARGMGIINGRLIEIAATSKLPGEPEPGASFSPRIVSVYAGKIVTSMSPFKHLVYKYDVYGDRNKVFAYLLNRGKKPWTKKELEDFRVENMLDIVNGFTEDKDARFLSMLNPFRLGGIFSRTTWRFQDDPVVGATGDFVGEDPKNRDWIGTGAVIELERDNLRGNRSRRVLREAEKQRYQTEIQRYQDLYGRTITTAGDLAYARIRFSLEKIARTQPLKLFFNLKGPKLKGEMDNPIPEDLQKNVLIALGKRATGDSIIDEELRGDLDTLVVLQEKAMRDALNSDTKEEVALNLSDETVGDPAKATRLRRFVGVVQEKFTQPQMYLYGRSHLDKFIEDLRDREWKLPFNFGTDDVPFEEYRFAKTSSDSFGRRWGDMGQGKLATDTMTKLVKNMPNFRSPDQILPLLHELYDHISFYDEGIAREVVMNFAEGIIKFYKKDWYTRLPFFMGTMANVGQTLVGRGSSFAELAFGKDQMSWDELDVSEFTSQLRSTGAFNLEQMNTLREKVGGNKREFVMAYIRLLGPIVSFAFLYYIISRSVRERS